MSHEEIQNKIDPLIEFIYTHQGSFEERDVVYLLVELYKVVERDLGSNRPIIKEQFTYLAFFRDWVVHTNMHDKRWVEEQETLNNPEALCDQLISVIDRDEIRKKFLLLKKSFIESLKKVINDQGIFFRVKIR